MKMVKLLQNDGTYVSVPPDQLEIQRHRFPKTTQAIIPMKSVIYGPLCTVASSFLYMGAIEASIIYETCKRLNLDITLSFRNVDTPLKPPMESINLNITNPNGTLVDWLKLYPALSKIESINSFIDTTLESDKEIIIENVKSKSTFANESKSLSEILAFLARYHMEPDIKDSDCYRFCKDRHEYTKEPNANFDSIVIAVPGSKYGYYLTNKQYDQLSHIRQIEFTKGMNYNRITIDTITDALTTCLYLPTYIEYEQATVDIPLDCKIIIHYDNQEPDMHSVVVKSDSRRYRTLNLFDLLTY